VIAPRAAAARSFALPISIEARLAPMRGRGIRVIRRAAFAASLGIAVLAGAAAPAPVRAEPHAAESIGEATVTQPAAAAAEVAAVAEPIAAAGASLDEIAAQLVDELVRARAVGPRIRRILALRIDEAGDVPRWLQPWLLPRRADAAAIELALIAAAIERFEVADLEVPPALAEVAGQARAFDLTPARISALNFGLDVDAVLVARVVTPLNPTLRPRIEALLLSGRAIPIAFEAEAGAPVPEALLAWNPRVAVWLVLPLALLLLRPMRVAGTLVVKLELRGRGDDGVVYTAYVARRSMNADASEKNVIQSKPLSGDSVSFQGLPARGVHVGVRRVERDPKTLKVSSNHLEERALTLARGRAQSVGFHFKADLTAVEVRLLQAENAPVTEQAVLAVHGQGASTRYLRGGVATLHLAEGAHVLLIGYVDRGFRIPLAIPPKTRSVDVKVRVDAPERALFGGCRDAVTPFVAGDFGAAADALAAAGQDGPASLLRAELSKAKGDTQEAARLFERAGRLKEAAELRAASGDSAGTADLLERAGDWAGAARQHKAAGKLAEAARAFARAELWDDALGCAAQSGERALLADVLEQKGERLEAARVALELAEHERATRLLQSIALSDPRYGEACTLLAQIFAAGGEPELALQKLDEAVASLGTDTQLELREQIARKLEEQGELRRALEAYEHIRKRDIGYPGMAEKIEALRTRLKDEGAAAVADAAATRIAGTNKSTRYDIQGEIGRGGMGVVYKARDRMLGRVVALKRLPDNLKEHPTAVKLFLREARAVAALNHPNIVTLYDAGQEDGAYYLTMEFLEGQPLHVPVARLGRFRVPDALKVGMQVMDGLGYAHEANIVHRDIKPSNIFLTRKGRVKIMDFGLAKMMEEVRKQASIIAGTPFYMAPEQAAGDVVDPRADLYAFGVTLYELLTGEVPFKDGDVTYHHRHTPPPDPRAAVQEVPAALAALVLALLAKRPDDRPATAAAVRERLASIAKGR
jgi:tRNA A-37 threonylcarbamoyl transferase component Bud32